MRAIQLSLFPEMEKYPELTEEEKKIKSWLANRVESCNCGNCAHKKYQSWMCDHPLLDDRDNKQKNLTGHYFVCPAWEPHKDKNKVVREYTKSSNEIIDWITLFNKYRQEIDWNEDTIEDTIADMWHDIVGGS